MAETSGERKEAKVSDAEVKRILESWPNVDVKDHAVLLASWGALRADMDRVTSAAAALYEACDHVLDDLDDDSQAKADVELAMAKAVRHDVGCSACAAKHRDG